MSRFTGTQMVLCTAPRSLVHAGQLPRQRCSVELCRVADRPGATMGQSHTGDVGAGQTGKLADRQAEIGRLMEVSQMGVAGRAV